MCGSIDGLLSFEHLRLFSTLKNFKAVEFSYFNDPEGSIESRPSIHLPIVVAIFQQQSRPSSPAA